MGSVQLPVLAIELALAATRTKTRAATATATTLMMPTTAATTAWAAATRTGPERPAARNRRQYDGEHRYFCYSTQHPDSLSRHAVD
ncbi:hypothetical protein BV349_01598 [Pseudomonas syringae pv. actinidiae]|nr:hypothetical protein BV349_01598 [Pseudomonas syringae pv. actinidiae]OSN78150.1 hypothetical protein BV351_01597 [Pseudomonas syringae pv. actinidiae]OSR75407.1 hypothetical protein BV326_00805 [Pseudomonas syringae pv. actinidiae]